MKMLQIKYFLCLMLSVKTSSQIGEILMSGMESPPTMLQKTSKSQFSSGKIDPRKVYVLQSAIFRANHVLIEAWHLKP